LVFTALLLGVEVVDRWQVAA